MPGMVKILIISPTRELASQIYEEGQMLCKFHVGFKLMCVFGGTNMKKVHATRGTVRVCARKGMHALEFVDACTRRILLVYVYLVCARRDFLLCVGKRMRGTYFTFFLLLFFWESEVSLTCTHLV